MGGSTLKTGPGRETPGAAQRGGNTGPLRTSWNHDLDAYVGAQASAAAGASPSVAALCSKLAQAIRVAPESAEAWWAFLQQEESATAARGAAACPPAPPAKGGASLFDLYAWATRLVPRQSNHNNEAYLRIWLGYARQQWARNQDDARDTLKTLRSQAIGEAAAALYYEWAALEAGAGNAAKATAVVAKGLREQAQPAWVLEQMQSDLASGRFVYRPSWAQDAGGKTSHSNGSATYAAFLTPSSGPDERRAPLATPTLDVTGGAAASDTVLLNRDARSRSVSAPTATESETALLGSRASAAPTTSTAATAAQPAAGLQPGQSGQQGQHTGGLTDKLNRTSLTLLSSSTGTSAGSEDSTMPMRTPRGAASHRSGGSSGSGSEEATVSLRRGGGSGGAAAGPGDETLVIPGRGGSRLGPAVAPTGGGAAPKEATAAPAGGKDGAAPLLKPRRIGMLGRALRVAPGSKPEEAPAAAEQGADEEEGRKRKAEGEAAQSPCPGSLAAGLGEAKRRQSPGDQAKLGAERPGLPPASKALERQLPPVPRFDVGKPPLPQPGAALGARGAPAAGEAQAAHARPAAPAHLPATAPPWPGAAPRPAAARAQPERLAAAAQRPRHQQQVVLGEDSSAADGRASDADEETAPVVMSKLAQRVQRGRQSLAPHKIVLMGDGGVVRQGQAAPCDAAGSDDDTALALQRGQAAAAAAEEDAEATRPLSRPPPAAGASPPRSAARAPGPRVQIDGAGNVAVVQPAYLSNRAALKALPVPPPPPPTLPAPAAAPAPPARMPMGPPSPRHARAATAAQPAPAPAPQQPAPAAGSRPGRLVVEDEQSVLVRGITYTKLECVGRGGSSKVYKVMAPNRKIFALKRIRLQGRDSEAASGFLDEITLLQRLAGKPGIIQLVDSEVHRGEGLIYMVLECGDIDLARLLQRHERDRQEKGGPAAAGVDENFVRLYWQQMLQAVDTIHRERIVHSDLKPANFLVVEGQLKLIDFGIAKAIQSDTTSIARETQVGTLNYMSPEAILGGNNNIRGGPPMKVGRASDIWSLGCILYQMVYGHTPFRRAPQGQHSARLLHLPFIQKMQAIIDPNHRIAFPPLANPALADELLEHQFLRPTAPAAAAAPAAAPLTGNRVGLSKEQLTKLLRQVSQAGVSPGADVDRLSEQLFSQLSSGMSPDLGGAAGKKSVARLPAAAAGGSGPPAAAAAAPPAQHRLAAASSAPAPAPVRQPEPAPAARGGGAAPGGQSRPPQPAAAAPAAPAVPRRAALAPISQSALLQQAAALRRVEVAAPEPHPAQKARAPGQQQQQQQQEGGGLEAALRRGLERFRFEDGNTAGEDDNTVGSSFGS
eukprot:scaffold10.g2275.t1